MPNKLYNILVPISFSTKNKWAIAKAIEIANSFDCNIHFVNVVHSSVAPMLPIESSIFTPYESLNRNLWNAADDFHSFINNFFGGIIPIA